jgi:3-phosphoshikimate 1-carboxyvinyltransferase
MPNPTVPKFRPHSSKSEMIRALILQSYQSDLRISGESDCEDVKNVRDALLLLHTPGIPLNLGDSGLGFRAVSLRAARNPGIHHISGTAPLLARPHAALLSVLEQVGCTQIRSSSGIKFQSPEDGQWRTHGPVVVPPGSSGQIVSGLLLNALGLDSELCIHWMQPIRSLGYVEITLEFLRRVGVKIEQTEITNGIQWLVPKNSAIRSKLSLELESDWSTAFTALAWGALRSGIEIQGLHPHSLQPDCQSKEWLAQMGVTCTWEDSSALRVDPMGDLRSIEIEATQCPDLVPVFSVLASLARGKSRVKNSPHLRDKESNRIRKAVQMARFLGAQAGETPDGFWIEGVGETRKNQILLGSWSCDSDHRQAMAALVALASGRRFEVNGLHSIKKSAPELLSFFRDHGAPFPEACVRVFIGNRGVGKTTLLQSFEPSFDLDQEIESQTHQKISELLRVEGEISFRKTEKTNFLKLIRSAGAPFTLALGAGFQWDSETLGALDSRFPCSRKIFLRRPSDLTGRIFTDRPRLDPKLAPLDEFISRRAHRETQYALIADQTLEMPEGRVNGEFERELILGNPDFSGASITLPSTVLKTLDVLNRFLSIRANWGLKYFEIREDFLESSLNPVELMEFALRKVGPDRLIWSRRLATPSSALMEVHRVAQESGVLTDWATDLGDPSSAQLKGNLILSCHQRTPQFPDSVNQHSLKWSPEVPQDHFFEFLEQGHGWWLKDRTNRVFLPRTESTELFPRLTWYRLWSARTLKPKLFYIREDAGSARDQPTLLQWLTETKVNRSDWGAVLGDPVTLSRSPETHGPGFYAISLREFEWDFALGLLKRWGMSHAAVTSPLKKKAFELQALRSSLVQQLGAANTLVFSAEENVWKSENTDVLGFSDWISGLGIPRNLPSVLWGGGGTVAMVHQSFSNLTEFSARTGLPRSSPPKDTPSILVWAVGRNNFRGVFPPKDWRPKWILDLNYAEDSPAREYALLAGLEKSYHSGLEFFNLQARAQREFWRK